MKLRKLCLEHMMERSNFNKQLVLIEPCNHENIREIFQRSKLVDELKNTSDNITEKEAMEKILRTL